VRLALGSLLLLAATAAAQAAAQISAAPREIVSEYRITQSGLTIGRVSESFIRTGDLYAITSTTRAEGALKLILDDTVTLESSGKVEDGSLVPLSFQQRRAAKPDRDIRATFDWGAGRMRASYRGRQIEAPIGAGMQDRLSIMYQFMNFGADARERVQVSMSNGRKVELYTYRLVEEVKLSTPAGEFQTLHYARVTRDPKDARAEVWLARDRFNFPVRVVFDDPEGLRLEQTLVALKTR
jgi:hypothetical protein